MQYQCSAKQVMREWLLVAGGEAERAGDAEEVPTGGESQVHREDQELARLYQPTWPRQARQEGKGRPESFTRISGVQYIVLMYQYNYYNYNIWLF